MRLRLLLLTGTFFLSAIPALADATYTYTGNPFTNVAGPFTSSNSITGYITTSSAIPPSTGNFGPTGSVLSVVIPDITSFSFTDGVDTLDNTNVSNPILTFATDEDGNIIAWGVDVSSGTGAEIFFSNKNPAGFGFSGNDSVFDTGSAHYAGNSTPGTWALGTDVSATPEPTGLTLLGTGAIGIAAAVRRKFRRV